MSCGLASQAASSIAIYFKEKARRWEKFIKRTINRFYFSYLFKVKLEVPFIGPS
jgi:hypothetical protein